MAERIGYGSASPFEYSVARQDSGASTKHEARSELLRDQAFHQPGDVYMYSTRRPRTLALPIASDNIILTAIEGELPGLNAHIQAVTAHSSAQ